MIQSVLDESRVNQNDMLYGQITVIQSVILAEELQDNKIWMQLQEHERADFDRYKAMSPSERELELSRLNKLYMHRIDA